MVLQVFANEQVSGANLTDPIETHSEQLMFGDHPGIDQAADDRDFVYATSDAGEQRFQMVFDELLLANNLEEIACADGTFDRVPEGATPDDIAACSGTEEERAHCKAVCVDHDGIVDMFGQADEPDGAADDFRFIDGIVTITCDGVDVPVSIENSFYNPSGNQLISALTGVDSLGPALFIYPDNGLRASSECSIALADSVVDKDHHQACAPAGGDIGKGCTEGDTSLLTFHSEPLTVATVNDGSSALENQDLRVIFTVPVTPETVAAFTVTSGGAAVPVTVTQDPDHPTNVDIKPTAPATFTPETTYDVAIAGASVTGAQFGVTMDGDVTFSVTTPEGEAPPDAMTTDGGPDDGGVMDGGVDGGLVDGGADAGLDAGQ
ncbi:MAG TPA: hypothetical protein VFG83_01085 [Kofleriaceae bacterium]|nr:hypothetical protein [Kofleriaceae bacterium]